MKKLALFLTAAAICLSLGGCGASKAYDEVSAAQKAVSELDSCKITVMTDKGEQNRKSNFKTEFSFKTNESGSQQYCQIQYDMNGKPVYCEYSDGEASEQWVLGKGWSRLECVPCTKKSPHRFMKLLSTPFDKKLIDKIAEEESGENKRFVISLNPEKLNRELYQKESFEVITETLTVILNADGKILCYNDIANVRDKESKKETLYKLDMMLSDYDKVKEIAKPEF